MTALEGAGGAMAPVPAPPRGEGLGFALSAVALQTVLFVAKFAVLAPLVDPDNPFKPTPLAFVLCLALEGAGAALVVWLWLGRVGGLSLARLGWKLSPWSRNLGEGAAGFLLAALFLLALLAATGADPVQEARAWLLDPTPADRALWLLIGICAPFTEESVFRGALQPALTRKLGRIAAVAAMAVIFSLYHLPRSPVPFLGRLLCGLVFGVLRERTGGLLAPWTAHLLVWFVIGTR